MRVVLLFSLIALLAAPTSGVSILAGARKLKAQAGDRPVLSIPEQTIANAEARVATQQSLDAVHEAIQATNLATAEANQKNGPEDTLAAAEATIQSQKQHLEESADKSIYHEDLQKKNEEIAEHNIARQQAETVDNVQRAEEADSTWQRKVNQHFETMQANEGIASQNAQRAQQNIQDQQEYMASVHSAEAHVAQKQALALNDFNKIQEKNSNIAERTAQKANAHEAKLESASSKANDAARKREMDHFARDENNMETVSHNEEIAQKTIESQQDFSDQQEQEDGLRAQLAQERMQDADERNQDADARVLNVEKAAKDHVERQEADRAAKVEAAADTVTGIEAAAKAVEAQAQERVAKQDAAHEVLQAQNTQTAEETMSQAQKTIENAANHLNNINTLRLNSNGTAKIFAQGDLAMKKAQEIADLAKLTQEAALARQHETFVNMQKLNQAEVHPANAEDQKLTADIAMSTQLAAAQRQKEQVAQQAKLVHEKLFQAVSGSDEDQSMETASIAQQTEMAALARMKAMAPPSPAAGVKLVDLKPVHADDIIDIAKQTQQAALDRMQQMYNLAEIRQVDGTHEVTSKHALRSAGMSVSNSFVSLLLPVALVTFFRF